MDAVVSKRYVLEVSDLIHTFSLGAFNYKNATNIWWKLWSLYNAVATVSIITANASYFIFEDVSLKELVLMSTSVVSATLILVVQRISYKFSENWADLKQILRQDFVVSLDPDGNLRQVERVKNLKSLFERKIGWLLVMNSGLAGMMVALVGNLLWRCTHEEVDIHDKFNYLYPFAGVAAVNGRKTFLFVHFLQSISFMGIGLTIPSTWLLLVIIIVEITNKTAVLEEQMKLITEDVHSTIALIRDNEMKSGKMKLPRSRELAARRAQSDRKICFEKFDENLITCIKHHQTLIKAVNLLRPLLNDYFTATLGLFAVTIIAAAFLIVSEKELAFSSNLVRYSILLPVMMLQVGAQCLAAQHFQNLNDTMAELVYSLPWYELPPSYRKNVYIFLCQAQAPVKFYAFKTFRFSTYFFPTFVNFVYTSTVNLLTIQAKFRRA